MSYRTTLYVIFNLKKEMHIKVAIPKRSCLVTKTRSDSNNNNNNNKVEMARCKYVMLACL